MLTFARAAGTSVNAHPGDLARPGRCLAEYAQCDLAGIGADDASLPCCPPWRCFRKAKYYSQCGIACPRGGWDCSDPNSTHHAGTVLPQPALHLAIVLPIPASCACKERVGRCDCLCNHVVRARSLPAATAPPASAAQSPPNGP